MASCCRSDGAPRAGGRRHDESGRSKEWVAVTMAAEVGVIMEEAGEAEITVEEAEEMAAEAAVAEEVRLHLVAKIAKWVMLTPSAR